MLNSKLIIGIWMVLLVLTTATASEAQYVIEQIEYEIPFSYELIPESVEFKSQEDEVNFILDIPEGKLKDAAVAEGREIKQEKMTIYIDGDNFAVEIESADNGKQTMITDAKTGRLYSVVWAEKKVFEMKPEDMEQTRAKVKATTDDMLSKLSPEMRAQIEAEMAKRKNDAPLKAEARPTGKKMKIYGFNCEEYRVAQEEKVISIWAATDTKGIVKAVERVSRTIGDLFNTDDDEEVDEWQLVPGKIPVQVRKISSSGMTGEPVVLIQAITKIETKKPSADKFKIPGEKEGFTKGSMIEMMMQMAPKD